MSECRCLFILAALAATAGCSEKAPGGSASGGQAGATSASGGTLFAGGAGDGGAATGGGVSGGAPGAGSSNGGKSNGGNASAGVASGAAGGTDSTMAAGGSADGGSADAGSSGGRAETCSVDTLGLRVPSNWDPLGYPSYAIDGCYLAYVASSGSLMLRTLATGDETELEPAANRPRRPALAGDVIAWEADGEGKSCIRVQAFGVTTSLSGSFDHAGEPAVTRDAVVFTAFRGAAESADSDILLYDVATRTLSDVFTGPGQQRFAVVSKDYVAATDFSEDPSGVFDEVRSIADIIVQRRSDGQIDSRPLPGKQAFPLLSDDGVLAYLAWGDVHPEPKFSAFALYSSRVDADPSGDLLIRDIKTDPSYVRPSLRDGVIDFVDKSGGPSLLFRHLLSGAAPPPAINLGADLTLFGPVANKAFTLIAARGSDGTSLRIVNR